MNALFATAEQLLRGRVTMRASHGWRTLAAATVVFGGGYGLIMGSYAGVAVERWLHLCYTAAKVPLLLGATFLLSWPSFALASCLIGLGADLRASWRYLLTGQCIVAIALASLAPVTAFWYLTVRDYKLALLCNAIMYTVASLAGQFALRRYYRPLIVKDARHGVMLWTWIGIYGFVGVQLAWVLRPFVGSPDEPVQFIRTGELSNAYVKIAALLWAAVTGG